MRVTLVLIVVAAAALLTAQTAGPACAPDAARGDADLYCIELLPAADIERATGEARLVPPSSPFGIAVTAAGEAQHDVVFTLRDLPAPASLGAYRALIAWAVTPQLHPVVKLGEVRDGETRLGRVPFDRFLVLITAEPDADVKTPGRRTVLRGSSASLRMQPHDIAFLLAGLIDRRAAAGGAHDSHAGHAPSPLDPAPRSGKAAELAPGEWTAPPMHPEVSMPPAFMALRPDVRSYLPAHDATAPLARPRELMRVADGARVTLTAAPVRRVIVGRTVTMLGFNGQYPGPLIHVEEASTITVRFVNQTDFPTAIHWHGLRLDNRFDGVPHVTQPPVPPGGTFDYQVHFPDPGIYWYHPHHREDVLQDLGLYGNLLVNSRDPEYFAPANRSEVLMLDDLLVADAGVVGYGAESPTHALMGRFGNVLLVNGEPRWNTEARRGEVMRLFLTNVSSTRVFNLSFRAAVPRASAGESRGAVRMKVVASDLGRYERETWVDNVTIAPAERYVVDVRFPDSGKVELVNRVRAIDHMMARFFEESHVIGVVQVGREAADPDHRASFERLRHNAEESRDIATYRKHFDRAVDHELSITLEAGDLPFPMRPLLSLESVYRNPVEWAGTMPEMDWIVTGRQVNWLLRDTRTGRENMDIAWRFRVGEVVKLRLINDRAALHAMHHPVHIHGQRFLVLSVNGVPNEHLVWKDTMLLPTGFVADVLLEITNPGKWMLHCHIAEHIEAGMRMVFEVER